MSFPSATITYPLHHAQPLRPPQPPATAPSATHNTSSATPKATPRKTLTTSTRHPAYAAHTPEAIIRPSRHLVPAPTAGRRLGATISVAAAASGAG
ncbi:hypothetical protein V496_01694 [Pseudogymnoascus sp. VKM F-4515 (FW-2607)]|nr:hypothetical protein V496_01694 [Pseudogymnoascus sp. VKM F-4515 (FW-2607)]